MSLLFNEAASVASLLNKRLTLSSSFRCDQIYKFNRVASGLLNKSSFLAPTLGATKFIIVTDMILATLCCAA